MMAAMNIGNLAGVGGNLFVIFFEVVVVGIDNIVDEKRQRPRGIILAPICRSLPGNGCTLGGDRLCEALSNAGIAMAQLPFVVPGADQSAGWL